MGALDEFRTDTRAWLDENCPHSMRVSESEDNMIGGGKSQVYANPDSKLWLDRMALQPIAFSRSSRQPSSASGIAVPTPA